MRESILLALIIFVSFLNFQNSEAQFENLDIGAKAISLGGAFTSLSDNSSAIYYNPAGISQIPFREISVFYSPAPFGMKEMSNGALTYAEPTKFGTFGIAAKTYGFELYREFTATFNYANNFEKRIFYGLNLNYYHLKIQNYGSATTFGVDAGLLAYLTDYMRWGFSAMNVNRAKIGQSKEKLPQVYRTGLSVKLRKDLNVILDVEKDTRYNASVKTGVEFSLFDMADFRAGAGSEPTRFSAGVGLHYSYIEVDYAFYNHQDMGLTHQASITVNFGGTKGRKLMKESLQEAFTVSPKDTIVKKTKPKKVKEGETININAAGVDELMRLPYVSEKMANDIIQYRIKNGGFKSAEELMNIKGIKEKRFAKIKPFVKLE
jgi:competence ComEA-like helix-hairpin-helix protein